MEQIILGDVGRRNELYEMLLRIGTSCYIDQERLVDLVGLYPPRKPNQSFHNSTARRMITRDIQNINNNPEYDHIILSCTGTQGIKIATKEEALVYVQKQQMACFKKLKRLSVLSDKILKQGQVDIEGKTYGVSSSVSEYGNTVSVKIKPNKPAESNRVEVM